MQGLVQKTRINQINDIVACSGIKKPPKPHFLVSSERLSEKLQKKKRDRTTFSIEAGGKIRLLRDDSRWSL
jgi:hypothetical protein